MDKPPPPAHGSLSCIEFGGNEICQVICKARYVPEKPHADAYEYTGGQWITSPPGYEFPWADCVAGKDTFLKQSRPQDHLSLCLKWRHLQHFKTFET